MPILDHFNFLAPYYDHLLKSPAPENIIQLAGLPVSGALLDAGGGTGRISQVLNGFASSIVVSDASLRMLSHASEKEGLESVCSCTEYLPFHDESFERVIMVDAIHHVLDQKATLRELWRVVKPGGRIVIEEPDIRVFSVKLMAMVEKIALMRSHFISPPSISNLFHYQNAHSRIERNGSTAWVIIDKLRS